MKNHELMAAILSVTLLLSGCSNPMNAELPQNVAELKDLKGNIDKLEGEDRRLINDFLEDNLMALTLGMFPKGMTVGDAITAQKEKEVKDREKQAVEKAKQDAKQAVVDNINAAVDVKYLHYDKFNGLGYSGYTITVEVKNNQSKPIIGIKGRLIFKDTFGKDVGDVGMEYESILRKDQYDYMEIKTVPFVTQGDKFQDGSYETNDVRFEPEIVVFGDKTKLSAPED